MNTTSERLTRLPIQLRPRPGESTDSFIRRLAQANHLAPSYLYGYLCGPPTYLGRPRPERLAALADRTVENLARALPDLLPRTSPRHSGTVQRHRRNVAQRAAWKKELFTRLRHEHAQGTSIRRLMASHGVGYRTVRQALENLVPPPRQPMKPRPSAIDPVKDLVDSMISDGLTVKEIWASLMDEHEAAIPYSTIRAYVHAQTAARVAT